MNGSEFNHNVNTHTYEELAPFEEQYVAWSEDGKQILAHARELDNLFREINRRQITDYVIEFIPSPEISNLGGANL
jgi:hypothetical protein